MASPRIKFGVPQDALTIRKIVTRITLQEAYDLLLLELEASLLYSSVWKESEDIFEGKKQSLLNQKRPFMPEECHVAIIAYTRHTRVEGKQLFFDFNQRCRGLHSQETWDQFPYKSLYYLLVWSQGGINNSPSIDCHTYRALNLYYEPSSLQVGQRVCFNQFTTSYATPQSTSSGTVIEFPQGAVDAIGIDAYYNAPGREVLIFPWSIFTVDSVEQDGQLHRIVLRNA